MATFVAIYRGDLDEVHRLQGWAASYFQRSIGKHNVVVGLCNTGLAAYMQLDLVEAETGYRKALKIAKRSGGSHSYTSRLASSLLGELLYERGDLDEAERLLDEGYKLGPEGGPVVYKLARYVTGARIKALRGDRFAVIRRLNEGARIAWALSLPRLHAVVENERIRLGLPVPPEFGALPVTSYDARREPVDVIDEITVQHEEDTAIRTLLLDKDPAQTDLACQWAQEWVDHLTAQHRPQALLQARLLLVACLVAAERTDEAKATLATIAAQCAQLGLVRYLVDGGPDVVATIAQLHADQQAGRWSSEWPEVPADFLERLVNAKAVQRI